MAVNNTQSKEDYVFRIECFVEDKKLAEALRALAGLVRGQPSVAPVVNVSIKKNGKLEAESDGSLLGMFAQHLSLFKGDKIPPKQVQEWLEEQGRAKASSSYLLRQAIGAKLLKREGKSSATTYRIVRKP